MLTHASESSFSLCVPIFGNCSYCSVAATWLVVHQGFTRLLDVVEEYKHYITFSTEPIEMGQEQWPFRATEQSPKVFVILSAPSTGVSVAACGLLSLP
jgi:hypothetical protein